MKWVKCQDGTTLNLRNVTELSLYGDSVIAHLNTMQGDDEQSFCIVAKSESKPFLNNVKNAIDEQLNIVVDVTQLQINEESEYINELDIIAPNRLRISF